MIRIFYQLIMVSKTLIKVKGPSNGVFEIRNYTDSMHVTETACRGCARCFFHGEYFDTEANYDHVYIGFRKFSGSGFSVIVVDVIDLGTH